MKRLLLALFLFINISCYSQFIQDIHGRPYQMQSNEFFEGTPLLFNDWVTAKLVGSDGLVFENIRVNIDLYQGIPLFIREGKIYTFTSDIKEFNIVGEKTQITYKKGLLIDNSLPDVFFEVLSTSPLVVMNIAKKVVELPSYGTGGKKYKFVEIPTVYATMNGGLQKISLNKSNAATLFQEKWELIKNYAEINNISFKTIEGWQAFTRHYQAL